MEVRETKFRTWLKSHLAGKGAHVTNIESSTKNGIPDTYIQIPGCTGFWLELKVTTRLNELPLLRPEQRVWGLKHVRADGQAWLLVFCEEDQICSIYRNPVEKIEIVGDYLRVLDLPIKQFYKGECWTILTNMNL
jgi:hypothetical protein